MISQNGHNLYFVTMAVQEHAFASGIINDAGIEAYDGVCSCRPSQPKPPFFLSLRLNSPMSAIAHRNSTSWRTTGRTRS
jgi:hypothetical protein